MFQRILVPLDGSPRAEQALSLAAQFARQSEGTIILLRVINLATEYWPAISQPYGITEAVVEGEKETAERYLHTIASHQTMTSIPTEIVAQFGAIAPTILAVANTVEADLIVMCSHGYTGITRMIMGSEAEKVARHASIPTLILHEQPSQAEEQLPIGHLASPLRVLVPLDGSPHAEAALEPASVMLAQYAPLGRKTALHLVRVVRRSGGENPESSEGEHREELAEAKHYLQALTQKIHAGMLTGELLRSGTVITWSVAIGKDVAEAIVRVAEGGEEAGGCEIFGGCDYIAISTHGRNAFQRWTMGSVAERVLHLSRHPLLVVRPSSHRDMIHPPFQRLSPSVSHLAQ